MAFSTIGNGTGHRESRCRAYTASFIRADCGSPLGKIKPVKVLPVPCLDNTVKLFDITPVTP